MEARSVVFSTAMTPTTAQCSGSRQRSGGDRVTADRTAAVSGTLEPVTDRTDRSPDPEGEPALAVHRLRPGRRRSDPPAGHRRRPSRCGRRRRPGVLAGDQGQLERRAHHRHHHGLRSQRASSGWSRSSGGSPRIGVIVVIAVLALVSRRWSAIRDVGLSGAVGMGRLPGRWARCWGPPVADLPTPRSSTSTCRSRWPGWPPRSGWPSAALPYLSRWLQRSIESAIVLLALAAVVNGSGLPVAILASLALGWGVTALVHLIVGSPLGLPSTDEVRVLLGDLGIAAEAVVPNPDQEWGVGRFTALVDGSEVDVSVYGRDASDAQLLAKTARFLFYRDSGPTLALTRRQQVEHEAYLTLMAARAGARVPAVLAAGPAGPAHDALLGDPAAGRRPAVHLRPSTSPQTPPAATLADDGSSGETGSPATRSGGPTRPPDGRVAAPLPSWPPTDGTATDAASMAPRGEPVSTRGPEISDAVRRRHLRPADRLLRRAGIAHGAPVGRDHRGRRPRRGRIRRLPLGLDGGHRRSARPGHRGRAGRRGRCGRARAGGRLGRPRRCRPTALVGALPFLQRAALGHGGLQVAPGQEGHS